MLARPVGQPVWRAHGPGSRGKRITIFRQPLNFVLPSAHMGKFIISGDKMKSSTFTTCSFVEASCSVKKLTVRRHPWSQCLTAVHVSYLLVHNDDCKDDDDGVATSEVINQSPSHILPRWYIDISFLPTLQLCALLVMFFSGFLGRNVAGMWTRTFFCIVCIMYCE